MVVSHGPLMMMSTDEVVWFLAALHCAASRGHSDCVETLVALCGADVDLTDSSGCTALFYGVSLGHADCAQLLLNYGANPNHQDHKGRTSAVFLFLFTFSFLARGRMFPNESSSPCSMLMNLLTE